MLKCNLHPWSPLIRPPLSHEGLPNLQSGSTRAFTCRNATASLGMLGVCSDKLRDATLKLTDLSCEERVISSDHISVLIQKLVQTTESGLVYDVLHEAEHFEFTKLYGEYVAPLWIQVSVPRETEPGTYRGLAVLNAGGENVAELEIEVDVSEVILPDPRDWKFFLNIWMNPASVARRHGVVDWSDEHFSLLEPYVRDRVLHGQKSIVVPICDRPWIDQTPDPYVGAVIWKKRGGTYEFDFTPFDRYVALHHKLGTDGAIHCYSITQGPLTTVGSVITYVDISTGEKRQINTQIGDPEYVDAWSQFLDAFRIHLKEKGWFDKTYLAFDEKPTEDMKRLFEFLDRYAPDFRTSLAGNTSEEFQKRLDDFCPSPPFSEHGIEPVSQVRRQKKNSSSNPDSIINTYYVCCDHGFPNTILSSPLFETRMIPMLALQGGYEGFLRWAYNDWTEDPTMSSDWAVDWAPLPSGDLHFVYPGEQGPITSTRWEQLRLGIQDYELALIAQTAARTSRDQADWWIAIDLICRQGSEQAKATDIDAGRRLLARIAEMGI